MKVIPQIATDFEEYPELGRLADASLRRIVELMEIHDIVELRRVHKTGVFDHPYVKDIVTPMGIPGVPNTIAAVRYNVGKMLLDYLELIGFGGVRLEVTQEDAGAIANMWSPRNPGTESKNENEDGLDPKPVPDTQKEGDTDTVAPASEDVQLNKDNKEKEDGDTAD